MPADSNATTANAYDVPHMSDVNVADVVGTVVAWFYAVLQDVVAGHADVVVDGFHLSATLDWLTDSTARPLGDVGACVLLRIRRVRRVLRRA